MRSSNIELCRIASILLVVILHSASWTKGDLSAIGTTNFPSLFLMAFSIIGANVFVFITGWFGVSYKRSSFINLLFIVLFWGITRAVLLWCNGDFVWKNWFVLSETNWFVISYLGLLLFSQMINNFIDNGELRTIRLFLLSFFIYQTWFGWFPALPHFDVFQGGYSFVSFIFIYMLARYLRKYGVPSILQKYSFTLYISISVLLCVLAYLSIVHSVPLIDYIYKYNNPLVILSAVAFFLSFYKLRLPSLKWINYIAASSLSVLLIHEPHPAHAYIKKQFTWLRDNSMGGVKC